MIVLNENLPVFPERVFELAARSVNNYRVRNTIEDDFIPDDFSPERTNVKVYGPTMTITLKGILAGTVMALPVNPSLTRVEITSNGKYQEFFPVMQEIHDRLKELLGNPAGAQRKVNEPFSDIGNKPGRPHKKDDVWAWEEIYLRKRNPVEVEKEWNTRLDADPNRMHIDLSNRKRQFNKIKKVGWYK